MHVADKAADWLDRAAAKCENKTTCQAVSVLEQTAPEGERDRIIVWGTAVGALADAFADANGGMPDDGDYPSPETVPQAVDIVDGFSSSKDRSKGEVSALIADTAARLRALRVRAIEPHRPTPKKS